MKLILHGTPNSRQREFFLSRARHTAYGGARGGGKSWAMRRKFVLLALRYPELNFCFALNAARAAETHHSSAKGALRHCAL
ncbi:MAG: hypothetical protein ACLUZ4_05055 [Christensenellaceae bacterium]